MLVENNKEMITDKLFSGDISKENFHNKLLLRVGSKSNKFQGVNFSHTYFEHCYFRNCVFDSCKFIGCKFLNSNFSGSSFVGCTFDYASFENTALEQDILDEGCPGYDNLKFKFARSLRRNFQNLGDAEGANKAIRIELEANKSHLWKSWNSKESYYRQKYTGWNRLGAFLKWSRFKLEEFIWGNGENPYKLIRTGLFIWLIMAVKDVSVNGNFNQLSSYWASFIRMPQVFLNIDRPEVYSHLYLSIIYGIRMVLFALFISIILKRYNKR